LKTTLQIFKEIDQGNNQSKKLKILNAILNAKNPRKVKESNRYANLVQQEDLSLTLSSQYRILLVILCLG
jgi:hypothetical protein